MRTGADRRGEEPRSVGNARTRGVTSNAWGSDPPPKTFDPQPPPRAAAMGAARRRCCSLAALAAILAAEAAPSQRVYPRRGLALPRAGTCSAGASASGRRAALQREIDDRSGELRRALTELEIAQSETVRRLSMAVEFRDEDTGAHIERIGRFSTLLAEQVGLDARASASGSATRRRCTTSARSRSPTRSC